MIRLTPAVFAGLLLLTLTAEAATVTRGPYLQMGGTNRITVRWRTDVATNSRVMYGTTQGNLASVVNDAASVTEHEVTLTGLTANTKYFYAVGSSTEIHAGNDANHFFVTSPSNAKPTRIWVLGDAGTANADQTAVKNAYYNFTGTRHTDLWLMLGDNAYGSGTDPEYQAAVFNMYPEMLRKSVLWSAVGNHDTASSSTHSNNYPYYKSFTFPTNAEVGGLASGTEQYYSFDYGNIHFVALDSQTSNRSSTGPMATWLTNDLAATNKPWTIVFFHHPPYTKGSHNSDSESQLIQMRENILPILESAGVDLVLCGHSHSYERSYLLDGHYGMSSTLTAAMKKNGGSGRPEGSGAYKKATVGSGANEGAVYAVAGSSGKISGGSLNHPAMFVSLNVLGSMVVDVDGVQLDAKFLDNNGSVRDYFTIIKGTSSDTTPPAAPTNLVVGTRTNTSISMSWTAATDNVGVSVYRIYRGGIEVGVSSTTNFTDSGLTEGANYSYTVRAQDAAGNVSPASNTLNTSTLSTSVNLVPAGSVWKYLDNGSNQGTAWQGMNFNDSAWASGAAQLGYGDGGEATVVSFGPNSSSKYITTYFRRAFTVADPSFSALTLKLLRDDGAVVYLNGVEVYRSNMPSGAITSSTLASSAIGGSDESTYYSASIPTSLLVMGTNVIAVEIHQSDITSSDISFDLSLAGIPGTNTNDPPLVATGATASPNPVGGKTTTLSVLGADDFGESNLTYTWATTGAPPAAVTFSANGTNAAKNCTATFTRAGSYSFQVTLRDQGNLTATSLVNVTVNATLSSIEVTPANPALAANANQQFNAVAKDQFGQELSVQPAMTWSLAAGSVGSINASGLYSSGATAGAATVQAKSGAIIGTASVTVASTTLPPEAPGNLTAVASSPTQINLTWTDASNTESGFELERSPDGITSWTLIATTAANVVSFSNTGLAAATTYYFRIRAVNNAGASSYVGPVSTTTMSDGGGGTPSGVKINFQASASPTPTGYVADSGALYGDRGNGFSYGWNPSNSTTARDRNSSASPDQRYDTLQHLQKPENPNAIWEIALLNGTYSVRVVCGDPSYFDSVYKISVEGQLAVNGTPTATQRWLEGTVTVALTDGRLTIASASGAQNNKICFVDITPSAPIQTLAARELVDSPADSWVFDPAGTTTISTAMLFSKPSGDSLKLKSTLSGIPADTALEGKLLGVDVGGAVVDFVLDSKGRGRSKQGATKVNFNTKSGSLVVALSVRKGQWTEIWADAGIAKTMTRSDIEMPYVITFGDRHFGGSKTLKYVGRKEKSGRAK